MYAKKVLIIFGILSNVKFAFDVIFFYILFVPSLSLPLYCTHMLQNSGICATQCHQFLELMHISFYDMALFSQLFNGKNVVCVFCSPKMMVKLKKNLLTVLVRFSSVRFYWKPNSIECDAWQHSKEFLRKGTPFSTKIMKVIWNSSKRNFNWFRNMCLRERISTAFMRFSTIYIYILFD